MTQDTLIRLTQVHKTFLTGNVETRALDGVDLDIQRGEFVAIMGPSGCGKSTLLNTLGLLDSPSTGSYLFGEHEVAGLSETQLTRLRKGNVGFVFQSFNLIDELTVAENVELPLHYLGVSKSERKKKVAAALERVGVAHRADHYPQQLSGGQQQRVAVARAVVTQPKVLLADEPTGNLDSHHGREIMELLEELHQAGTTIIMVTHSESDAQYSDRILRLLDGRLIESETVQRIAA